MLLRSLCFKSTSSPEELSESLDDFSNDLQDGEGIHLDLGEFPFASTECIGTLFGFLEAPRTDCFSECTLRCYVQILSKTNRISLCFHCLENDRNKPRGTNPFGPHGRLRGRREWNRLRSLFSICKSASLETATAVTTTSTMGTATITTTTLVGDPRENIILYKTYYSQFLS